MDIYQENGFKDRQEYLEYMSEDYEIAIDFVIFLADILGPSEDFDGLVTALQDHHYMM